MWFFDLCYGVYPSGLSWCFESTDEGLASSRPLGERGCSSIVGLTLALWVLHAMAAWSRRSIPELRLPPTHFGVELEGRGYVHPGSYQRQTPLVT